MRTLTASETEGVGGAGLPIAAYYGMVALLEACPAIAAAAAKAAAFGAGLAFAYWHDSTTNQ
jgi:hypothetical protein